MDVKIGEKPRMPAKIIGRLAIYCVALMVFVTTNALAQAPPFKIENPQSGYRTGQMGCSVSMDGDTMIVGADLSTNPSGIPETGGARIYVCNDQGTWVLQAKLFATDAEEDVRFGCSVSISGDTALIGAAHDNDGGIWSGAAYVFTRSGGAWTQQQKLTASDAADYAWFGGAVSLSGDTALIGPAYVFTRSDGVWTEQQKLTASDPSVGDWFGCSVSVSGDTALVGARQDDDWGYQSGATYVYTRSGGVWTEQRKLTATDAEANDLFGCSVSVSGDTALVGARGDDEGGYGSGAAYVFTRSGGVWTEQQKLGASGEAKYDEFGCSVSISGDTAAVGAYGDTIDRATYYGAGYAFTRSDGVWTRSSKMTASNAAPEDFFGYSVAVSGDTAVFGAYYDDDAGSKSGAAYVFTRSGTYWRRHQKLDASEDNSAQGDNFGHAVAVSGDTAVIGAHRDNDEGYEKGTAYVFTRSGNAWVEQQKLIPTYNEEDDWFGYSVAISGDTVIVGAPRDDDFRDEDSGSAYVFKRSGGVWTQQKKLTASDDQAGDWFGYSVAIEGDTALIGAAWDDDKESGSGSAYIFTRSGGSWTQRQKMTAPDGEKFDNFGCSVSVSGNTALVGMYGDSTTRDYDLGSAYVFTRSGSWWIQPKKLTASDGEEFDRFGKSVSVSGDTALIGAYENDDAGSNSGSAYVFTRSGDVWIQQQKLIAADAQEGDCFGRSVSVQGDTALVGASGDDDAGIGSGSAYLFTHLDGVWTQQQKLTPDSVTAEYDSFGNAVSLSDDTALVGAQYSDAPEFGSGAAYAIDLSNSARDWMLYE